MTRAQQTDSELKAPLCYFFFVVVGRQVRIFKGALHILFVPQVLRCFWQMWGVGAPVCVCWQRNLPRRG